MPLFQKVLVALVLVCGLAVLVVMVANRGECKPVTIGDVVKLGGCPDKGELGR